MSKKIVLRIILFLTAAAFLTAGIVQGAISTQHGPRRSEYVWSVLESVKMKLSMKRKLISACQRFDL